MKTPTPAPKPTSDPLKEAAAMKQIVELLMDLPEQRRPAVFKAACVLLGIYVGE